MATAILKRLARLGVRALLVVTAIVAVVLGVAASWTVLRSRSPGEGRKNTAREIVRHCMGTAAGSFWLWRIVLPPGGAQAASFVTSMVFLGLIACAIGATLESVAEEGPFGVATREGHWERSLPLGVRRIINDPYATVDWDAVQPLKTQFHDHTADWEQVLAYDKAGYEAVSLFDYSGRNAQRTYWTERRWPIENWLPEGYQNELTNVKFLFANAEEVGPQHFTSPFLESYIEYRTDDHTPKLPYHYDSMSEGFELVRELGGIPFLAHPWECCDELNWGAGGPSYHAVEIYSAYFELVNSSFPRAHEHFLDFWHRALIEKPMVYGIAVNDHFGPGEVEVALLDSGKTLVLSAEPSLGAFRQAIESGAMLAVKDLGVPKDQYPQISRIAVLEDAIKIELASEGNVTWIAGSADGQTRFEGNGLDLSKLDPSYRYVRAEVKNKDGSTVFTQPWALRSEFEQGYNIEIDWSGWLSAAATPFHSPYTSPVRMRLHFTWTPSLPHKAYEIDLPNALAIVGMPKFLVDGEDTGGTPYIDETGALAFPVGRLRPGPHTMAFSLPAFSTYELGSFVVALPGDANLDGRFSQLDLVHVFDAGQYLTGQATTWGEGDWNGDGLFDQLDLVAALETGDYLARPYAERLASIPEPSTLVLASFALLGLFTIAGQKRKRQTV